jgi:GNAT superfamily N-acetyltransferase
MREKRRTVILQRDSLMYTYYLGIEEVRAYLRELLGRLLASKPMPTVWCPMTESGVQLLEQLIDVIKKEAPGLPKKVKVLSIYPDSKNEGLRFSSPAPSKDLRRRHVLLFDAAVHSGKTMAKAVRSIREYGAAEVCTYTLVLKRGSSFIPSLWGVMVNDQDRAYFLLERTPNNRLTTHLSETFPYLHLRRLAEEDMGQPPVKCKLASMDRVTWGDRWFDMAEGDRSGCTYLLETSAGAVGYLTVHHDSAGCMVIDEVAVDQRQRNRGYGGVLVRFADTLARHGGCSKVRLNAISNLVKWYGRFGYKVVPGRNLIRLDDEKYQPMERRVLYHLPRTNV